MQTENNILDLFKGYRFWLALTLGLFITVFLLFRQLNDTRFVKVKKNDLGTHAWVDVSHNGSVDFWDSKEFVEQKFGNYRRVGVMEALHESSWTFYSIFWLMVAILMVILRDFFYILRIRLLTDHQLSWRSSFYVILLWEYASALTPGVVGGAAVAMFLLHKEKISLGRSTAIVIVTAFMDNLFFVLMVPFLFLMLKLFHFNLMHGLFSQSISFVFWLGYGVIAGVCALLFASIFLFPGLLSILLNTIFKLPFLRKFANRAQKIGADVELASGQFRQYPNYYWVKVFAFTFLSWSARYLVINFLLVAFLPLTFLQQMGVFAKQFSLWVLMLISPTPGAGGVAEWAFSILLNEFSPSTLLIISIAVIWRLLSYYPYLLVGTFLLPRWLRKR
jgi:uncharacterized protein (TIRG00374 family)